MKKLVIELIDLLIENGLLSEGELLNKDNYRDIIREASDNVDSLLYISIIISIEEKYDIEMPDKAMLENILSNIDLLADMIDEIKIHNRHAAAKTVLEI